MESLQRKLHGLQAEMRMICKENQMLSEKLEKLQVTHSKSIKFDVRFDAARGKFQNSPTASARGVSLVSLRRGRG